MHGYVPLSFLLLSYFSSFFSFVFFICLAKHTDPELFSAESEKLWTSIEEVRSKLGAESTTDSNIQIEAPANDNFNACLPVSLRRPADDDSSRCIDYIRWTFRVSRIS